MADTNECIFPVDIAADAELSSRSAVAIQTTGANAYATIDIGAASMKNYIHDFVGAGSSIARLVD